MDVSTRDEKTIYPSPNFIIKVNHTFGLLISRSVVIHSFEPRYLKCFRPQVAALEALLIEISWELML